MPRRIWTAKIEGADSSALRNGRQSKRSITIMRKSLTVVALAMTLCWGSNAGAQGANAKVAAGSPTADKLPIYEVDPTWKPDLPNDWIMGDIRGLFADENDHLWVIHMPSSLTD